MRQDGMLVGLGVRGGCGDCRSVFSYIYPSDGDTSTSSLPQPEVVPGIATNTCPQTFERRPKNQINQKLFSEYNSYGESLYSPLMFTNAARVSTQRQREQQTFVLGLHSRITIKSF